MKNFWENVKLGNISSMQYGFTASAKEKEVGPKFLRITDIVKDSINWSTVPYCKINNTNYKKYKIEEGDIVIARTGATAGYAKLIKNPPDAVFASYLIRVKFSQKCIPGFGGKLIESNIFKNFIKQNITGSAQPHANAPILKKFKFLLPPLKIQGKIASILSAYDELIEKNNRRIEILEEMAETIYKEWFVHFRFPGHEKVEMIDSELGKIPEGWEVIDIYNLIEEKNIRNDKDEKLPVLSVTSKRKFEYSSKYFSKRVYSKSLKKYKIVQKSEIAFNPARINIGSIAFLDDIDKAIISPMYTVFKAKKEKIEPLFLWKIINQENVFKYMKKLCFGTVRQIFKVEDFSLVYIALPSLTIQKEYIERTLAYRELVKKLIRKNETLESIKNLLLPKLISGKIDVSDLDIKIEEKK